MSIHREDIIDRALAEANADEMVGEQAIEHAVDVTIKAIIEHIEDTKEHYGLVSLSMVTPMEILLAELRKDLLVP